MLILWMRFSLVHSHSSLLMHLPCDPCMPEFPSWSLDGFSLLTTGGMNHPSIEHHLIERDIRRRKHSSALDRMGCCMACDMVRFRREVLLPWKGVYLAPLRSERLTYGRPTADERSRPFMASGMHHMRNLSNIQVGDESKLGRVTVGDPWMEDCSCSVSPSWCIVDSMD